MPVTKCKTCGKLMKRSQDITKCYPEDYDFECCNLCNAKASNED